MYICIYIYGSISVHVFPCFFSSMSFLFVISVLLCTSFETSPFIFYISNSLACFLQRKRPCIIQFHVCVYSIINQTDIYIYIYALFLFYSSYVVVIPTNFRPAIPLSLSVNILRASRAVTVEASLKKQNIIATSSKVFYPGNITY